MEAQILEEQTVPENKMVIVMSLLLAISSFITAYLTIFGRYIELGYKVNDADLAYAGMQIWDLHLVFVVITVIIALCRLACSNWRKIFGHNLSFAKALAILLVLLFLGITFFPKPFEFQIRQYTSLSQSTYILLAQDSGDFIDGNENSFSGSSAKETVENYYQQNGESRYFNCVSERSWWWGKLAIKHNFFPILDRKNHLKLLQTNCKEITND